MPHPSPIHGAEDQLLGKILASQQAQGMARAFQMEVTKDCFAKLLAAEYQFGLMQSMTAHDPLGLDNQLDDDGNPKPPTRKPFNVNVAQCADLAINGSTMLLQMMGILPPPKS